MIFMGQEYWTETKPVYPLLKQLAEGQDYDRWLSIHDDRDKIVAEIQQYHEGEQIA